VIDKRCPICKDQDVRRLIELGWNAKMTCPDLSRAFNERFSASRILKHLKEHAEDGTIRDIQVLDAVSPRERITALQRRMLDEVEYRLALAEQRAQQLNDAHKGEEDWIAAQPFQFYDILSKDVQAAIGSILRTQGLADKREAKEQDVQVDVWKMMLGSGGGLAPTRMVGDGEEVEGVATPLPDSDD